jgi:LysR family transcriptional regulator, glycine cleavage system transcriptional activator
MNEKSGRMIKVRDLPLPAMRSFAAAARWETLTGAAEHLGVTYGAVSHQVRKLEEWIGQDLFIRQGRRLVLTPAGRTLASRIDRSLSEILGTCMEVSGARHRRVIVVEAPTSFAMYWLLPRLTCLEAQLNGTEISVSTRMTNQHYDGPLGDVVITRGQGADRRLQDYKRCQLITETMGLLSSPDFAEAADIQKAREVLRFQMVGSVTRPTDWANWLKVAGITGEHPQFRHRFDHLFVALHAVRDGVGTIVAPANIFMGASFVQILADIQFIGETYYIHYRDGQSNRSVGQLVEALMEQASTE